MRTGTVRVGQPRDTGFTMVELMMVVAIIAILILIALPTFAGAKGRADERRAMSILHTSLLAARDGAADTGDYAWVTPASLQSEEHAVSITDALTPARATSNQVSIATGSGGTGTYVIMATLSANGKCYALLDQTAAATTYQVVDPAASCKASDFDAVNGWGSTW
jgi:type IV pilus assembly protein PilA